MPPVNQIIAVAIGGALGSVLRFGVSHWVQAGGRTFPYGTLVVNVVGCFAMGMLLVWLVERNGASAWWTAGLLVGVLGGFTTFSAFSIETLRLMEGGLYSQAFANVFASVILCLGAAWLGLTLSRAG